MTSCWQLSNSLSLSLSLSLSVIPTFCECVCERESAHFCSQSFEVVFYELSIRSTLCRMVKGPFLWRPTSSRSINLGQSPLQIGLSIGLWPIGMCCSYGRLSITLVELSLQSKLSRHLKLCQWELYNLVGHWSTNKHLIIVFKGCQ